MKLVVLADKSLEKVVYNLHNKNLSWFKLFEHKTVLKILDKFSKKDHIKMLNLII